MTRYVALVRGINVGPTTKVPMPVLRAIFENAGCTDVSTLINSGNVVFTAPKPPAEGDIEARIAAESGVTTRVLVMTGARITAIADAMPFEGDESRLVVTFMRSVPSIEVPTDLAPELIQVGPNAVYQWLPDGVSKSKLARSFWKQFPPEATGRNLRTVKKLLALL